MTAVLVDPAFSAQSQRPASTLAKASWAISLLASVLAALFGFASIGGAESAPQQAAGAAIACVVAIVPYVFARGVDQLTR